MAVFGNQNFATPFGALTPSGFFDASGKAFYSYSGFSSREGFFGFSGMSGLAGNTFTGFSAFCGDNGIEFLPWRPTLVFPRTYALLEGVTPIFWEPARPTDSCGDSVTYTVQFTRSFSQNTGWRTIRDDIPEGTNQLEFDVSGIPFTEDGGIRVRAKDVHNLYSEWSTNVEPFTIKNHAPNPVTLLFPVGRETFDNSLLVIWREAEVADLDGHQVFYIVEVTDKFSKNEGWVIPPDGEALTQGTTSFTINSFDFPDGDDYGVRVTAVDEFGARSASQAAGGIKIRHAGNFIIDTKPPVGTLLINDGAALAKDTRVKLSLFARDDATRVKDVRFRNEGEECWGDWDTYTPQKFWDLTESDGVKRVFVQYRDCAGNVSEVCDCEIVSRVLCDEGNATDIEVFANKLYVAFDKNGNLIEYRVLVDQAAELPEPQLTALAKLGNILYIATHDPDVPEAGLYRYDGSASKLLTIDAVKVLSMVAYKDKLYLGLDDDRIMELDGTSLATSFVASSPVSRLRTDGSILFAALAGGSEFLTFDGTNWKQNLV